MTKTSSKNGFNHTLEEYIMDKAIQIAYDQYFELKCELAGKAGFEGIAVNFHDMTDRSEKLSFMITTIFGCAGRFSGFSCRMDASGSI